LTWPLAIRTLAAVMTQTKVPYLDLKAQYHSIRDELKVAWEEICESSRFAQGPAAQQFEREFAAYCGVSQGVSLNSGTSALHLALRCLDVGPGDEVITVSMTFIATVWAISYVGARPVFVDIDPARRTLDPAKLEAAITPRTKTIIPVHLFGMPADLNPILTIAAKHGIPVIEDAAQAHGARYHGKRVGQFGLAACFSFYPGKNLGAYGEGGALVTNDTKLAARARSLREHGQSQRYYHDELGYNYRMDSLQGAVLSIKLRSLDAGNRARAAHAKRYSELLAGSACVTPASFPDSECVWHCYVVEAPNREQVRAQLAGMGIDTAVHYPVPVHLQKAYASLGHKPGDLPMTEALCHRCLSLPMYPELTDEQLTAVASALRTATASA
jgi:dTDP-4-amino-4,6-dideoxygalactose transaminase